jgi:P22 tail accessory factor
MWTKRDLVNQALDELGLSSAVFDMQPEQMESVKRRLDLMMASWNAEGIRLGYPVGSLENSDLDDDSGLPDVSVEAVYLSLAVMIGPMFGRIVSDTTKSRAAQMKNIIKARWTEPPRQKMRGDMPAGAGNRGYQPFLSTPPEPVTDGSGGIIVE